MAHEVLVRGQPVTACGGAKKASGDRVGGSHEPSQLKVSRGGAQDLGRSKVMKPRKARNSPMRETGNAGAWCNWITPEIQP